MDATHTGEQRPAYPCSPHCEGYLREQAAHTKLIAGLRERADWLRSEYLNGGDRAHLEPRETECRAIAELIQRGRFS